MSKLYTELLIIESSTSIQQGNTKERYRIFDLVLPIEYFFRPFTQADNLYNLIKFKIKLQLITDFSMNTLIIELSLLIFPPLTPKFQIKKMFKKISIQTEHLKRVRKKIGKKEMGNLCWCLDRKRSVKAGRRGIRKEYTTTLLDSKYGKRRGFLSGRNGMEQVRQVRNFTNFGTFFT